MGIEARRDRARAADDGVAQHLRRDNLRLVQLWTSKIWRDVYNFPSRGAGLANRMDTYVDGKFTHVVDPKDGYPVRDYHNARQCRLQECIVPNIHPDKPIRVTIMIGNTIFGALESGRLVDWGVVFRDLAQRLAVRMGKPKPTPICPFLFHLYDSQGLLTKKKSTTKQLRS